MCVFFEYFEIYSLKILKNFLRLLQLKVFKKLVTDKLDKKLGFQTRPLLLVEPMPTLFVVTFSLLPLLRTNPQCILLNQANLKTWFIDFLQKCMN